MLKALDPIARTLLTEVHIHNPEYELFVGLYADVKFLLKPDNIYFLIPTSAVIIRADGPKVAVLDENNIIHYKKCDSWLRSWKNDGNYIRNQRKRKSDYKSFRQDYRRKKSSNHQLYST